MRHPLLLISVICGLLCAGCPSYSYPPEWVPDVLPYPGADVPDSGPKDTLPDVLPDTDVGLPDGSPDADADVGKEPLCGDGVLDTEEECDDGNLEDGDGCASDCLWECGDSELEGEEECDDGNHRDGDGCSSTCLLEEGVCSDTIVDLTPLLSEGAFSYAGSTSNAGSHALFSCGPGRGPSVAHALYVAEPAYLQLTVEAAYSFPLLSIRAGDCSLSMSERRCNSPAAEHSKALAEWAIPARTQLWIHVGGRLGNAGAYSLTGQLKRAQGEGEPCDVINAHLPCGAGLDCIAEAGNYNCRRPICGDGLLYPSEGCDDPEDERCMKMACHPGTRCGDGKVNGDEECDDGNASNRDTCSNDCRSLACGDGILQPGEECDDGNGIDGDGCSATCEDELGLCSAERVTDLTAQFEASSPYYEENDLADLPDVVEPSCLATAPSLPERAYRLVTTNRSLLHFAGQFERGQGVLSIREGDCYTSARELYCDLLHPSGSYYQLPAHSTLWLIISAGTANEAPYSYSITMDAFSISGAGERCKAAALSTCEGELRCIDGRCSAPYCGDGVIDTLYSEEECEPPNVGSCDASCHFICGDGRINPTEDCDDGNPIDGDGCSAQCVYEISATTCSGGPIVDLTQIVASGSGSFTFSGNNIGAPDLYLPMTQCPFDEDDGHDRVLMLPLNMAPSRFSLFVDESRTDLDLVISVTWGPCYNLGARWACFDPVQAPRLELEIPEGHGETPIWLVVHGRNGATGNFTLNGNFTSLP